MRMQIKTLMTVVGFALLTCPPGFAKDEAAPFGQDVRELVRSRIDELKVLRERNPEVFREEMKKHKGLFREQLRKLKEEHPEQFEKFIESHRGERRGRLLKLKDEHPEEFQKFLDERRGRVEQRARNLRRNDPDRYRQFVGKHAGRLQWLKEHKPERFEQFMEHHPRLREHLEDLNKRRDVADQSGGSVAAGGPNREIRGRHLGFERGVVRHRPGEDESESPRPRAPLAKERGRDWQGKRFGRSRGR